MIKQAEYEDTVQESSYEPDTIHSEPWLTRAASLSNHKKTWLNLLYRIIASLTVFILRASLELAISNAETLGPEVLVVAAAGL